LHQLKPVSNGHWHLQPPLVAENENQYEHGDFHNNITSEPSSAVFRLQTCGDCKKAVPAFWDFGAHVYSIFRLGGTT
jgi:hypothetical protein